MHLKTCLGAAGTLALLVSTAQGPATARAPEPALVAQAMAGKHLTTKENDERMTECARWRSAYYRLDKVKEELSKLQTDFSAADDIRPKLDELVTQTNDAMTTAQRRVRTCPANLQ